jgi:hypothetical protein
VRTPTRHESNHAQQHAGKQQSKDYDAQVNAATKPKKTGKSGDAKRGDRKDVQPDKQKSARAG